MKKKITALVSIAMILVLVATGTFAWVNFSQSIINEFDGKGKEVPEGNPGGTLHDDYDKENGKKEVYIENWGDTPIYVRIRLDEYMEMGEGAGKKGSMTEIGFLDHPDNKATPFIPGSNINKVWTWRPHAPWNNTVELCNPSPKNFHAYWEWKMGGSKIYLPAGSQKTNPSYVDQNTTFYPNLLAGLKQTQNAEVITMVKWHQLGKPIGNYWVVDADGWAYWAAPLYPGDATGLLLKSVTKIQEPADSYYYAINVIAQMATKYGDLNYENFYDGSDEDHNATDDGEELLHIITGGEGTAVSVKINGGDKTLLLNQEEKLVITTQPASPKETPAWSSSNPNIVTVDQQGNIKGIAVGEAEITVTMRPGVTDKIKVTVIKNEVPATKVTIEGDAVVNLKVGENYTPSIKVEPANATDTPAWSSNQPNIASVDAATGKITGVAKGTAIITVTLRPGVFHSISVNVADKDVDPIEVEIETVNGDGILNLVVGQTHQAKIAVTPANSTYTASWSSANSGIASVNSTGLIKGEAVGTTTVTVTLRQGVSHTITVNVTAAPIPATNVTINGAGKTIKVGETYEPGCTVTPSNSTDKPKWTSSDPTIASVDETTGAITGKAAGGPVTITVTAGTKTAAIGINVIAAEDPKIPTLNGEGPYDTVWTDDPNLQDENYSYIFQAVNGNIIPDPSIDQDGSVKLSSIVAGNDYSGINIMTTSSQHSGHFRIGTDKDGDLAILYTYIPAISEWMAVYPNYPYVVVDLLLTKNGYQNTPIKVILRYEGSAYGIG